MEVIRTILTPWAPYSVMFSHDGSRLAIGGGSWYGDGGIMLAYLSDDAVERISSTQSNEVVHRPSGVPTVSGVYFSSDDSHLAASTWASGHRYSPAFLFRVSGLQLFHQETFERGRKKTRRGSCPTGVLL